MRQHQGIGIDDGYQLIVSPDGKDVYAAAPLTIAAS